MHICADEIIAVSTALSTALPFIPRIRKYLNGLVTDISVTVLYFLFHKSKNVSCTCPKCVLCECDSCEGVRSDPYYTEVNEMRQWLTHVAPLLGNNPPPEDAKYTWAQRISSDGSDYIVHGVIYPIGPRKEGNNGLP